MAVRRSINKFNGKKKLRFGMGQKVHVLFIVLFFSIPAQAETLWMRHGLTTGSNDGSSYYNAFQGPASVQWGSGNGKVGASDTLYACGGPYNEMFQIGASGTKDEEINIRGDCSSVNANYKDGRFGRVSLTNLRNHLSGQSVSLVNKSYITIRNLTFENPLGVRHEFQTGLKAESKQGEHDGADRAYILRDDRFANNGISNGMLVGGIVWNLTDGSRGIITANTSTTIQAKLTGGQDNRWDNGDRFQITDDEASIEISASYGNRSHHITIRDCKFYLDDTDVGFSIVANTSDNQIIHDISIRNNYFQGNNNYTIQMSQARYTSTGPCGQLYNITIKDNTINESTVFFRKWGPPKHLDWEGCSNLCSAAGQPWDCCTGKGTGTCRTDCGRDDDDYAMYGLDIDGNAFNEYDYNPIMLGGIKGNGGQNYIRNNTFTSTGTQRPNTNLLQLYWIKDVIIENNYIEGPSIESSDPDSCDGVAIIIDWLDRSNDYICDNVIIRGNMIVDASSNCDGKGISVYKGSNIIVNNNIVVNSDIGILVSNAQSKNVRLYNNTVVDALHGIRVMSDAPLVDIKNNLISNSTAFGLYVNKHVGNIDEDYNLIYNSGERDYTAPPGRHSISGQNPRLTGDYRLLSGSPAIDAGVIVDVAVDFKGKRVPNGLTYDIGAIENYENVLKTPSAPKNVRFFTVK